MTTRFERNTCRSRRGVAICLVLGHLSWLPACDRGTKSESPSAADTSQPASAPARHVPTLVFPAEVRAVNPEIGTFLDEFLNAWLSMDYLEYRRLVSRTQTPEGRERFESICEGTAAVRVESVELLESPHFPEKTYRAVFEVELTPEAAQRRREVARRIAIVIFPELNEWRMAAAPAEFQPEKEPTTASAPAEDEAADSELPASAPTATAPAYPWDEEGDY